MNINIRNFLKRFNENYDYLYEAEGEVAGYREAVEYGDWFIHNHKDFVAEFNRYRGDILTSDREVAAFAFTLEDMGGLE